MQTHNGSPARAGKLIGRTLTFYFPAALLVTLVLGAYYVRSVDSRVEQTIAEEANRVQTEAALLADSITEAVSDVMYVAELFQFASPTDESRLHQLEGQFALFARTKEIYDQVRFLDNQGMEKVRINFSGGKAKIVPPALLQDKSSRYYYLEAVKLNRSSLYISPLDLNVEHGRVERPFKPVIRFSAPVFNSMGVRRGVVVMNMLGDVMLDIVKRRHVNSPGKLSVVNHNGYWMVGESTDDEWGFMLKDGAGKTFAKRFPEEWAKISTEQGPQIRTPNGLFSFARISPTDVGGHEARRMSFLGYSAISSSEAPEWYVISRVPNDALTAAALPLRELLTSVWAVLQLVTLLGCLFMARAQLQRTTARTEIEKANTELRSVVSSLETQKREIGQVNELVDFLQACRSLNEIYELVGIRMAVMFPQTTGALYVASEGGDGMDSVATWGKAGECSPSFIQDDCWALRRGQTHVLASKEDGPRCRHIKQENCGSICVPLIAHGKVTGMLHLRFACTKESNGTAQAFLKAREHMANAVAEHVALTLSNLKLRETLREQSIRDPLTGLYNRRHMEESLAREFHRANRHEAPLSVILFDVDHFKRFNDDYGHETGDVVLQRLGSELLNFGRGEDIPCRFGGEEFLIIMPGATTDDASRRAEELRTIIERDLIIPSSEKPLSVTVSLGVAEHPTHAQTAETLVSMADAALYKAKQSGRNRVEVARTQDSPEPEATT